MDPYRLYCPHPAPLLFSWHEIKLDHYGIHINRWTTGWLYDVHEMKAASCWQQELFWDMNIQFSAMLWIVIVLHILSKRCLNRPTTGPTLRGPFREVIALRDYNIVIGHRLGSNLGECSTCEGGRLERCHCRFILVIHILFLWTRTCMYIHTI